MVDRARRGKLPAGRYRDADGLMLVATDSAGSWILRYQLNGRRRDMGLGSVKLLGLAQARELAQRRRFEIHINKTDPLAERESRSRTITFAKAAEAFIASHSPAWRDPLLAKAWHQSLRDHALPVIGHRTVDRVDTQMVMDILRTLWATRTATAAKVRSRIERILSWSTVQGYRSGENPARWRGHLDQLLPAKAKVAKTTHHAAVPADQVGAVWRRLSGRNELELGAACLRFQILTASRPSEALRVHWTEVNFEARTWTLPAQRAKANRQHVVPLARQAVAILETMRGLHGELVFAGVTRQAARRALKAAGGVGTLHGWRSVFDSWAHRAGFTSLLVDIALSHRVGDATVQAYRRDPMVEERRPMMQRWADSLDG
jgi:integrase